MPSWALRNNPSSRKALRGRGIEPLRDLTPAMLVHSKPWLMICQRFNCKNFSPIRLKSIQKNSHYNPLLKVLPWKKELCQPTESREGRKKVHLLDLKMMRNLLTSLKNSQLRIKPGLLARIRDSLQLNQAQQRAVFRRGLFLMFSQKDTQPLSSTFRLKNLNF